MRFITLPVEKKPAGSRLKQAIFWVLLMLLGIVNTLAAQSLTLEYKEIDASGFPRIASFVSVRDNAGALIAGLTEANFTVREDGRLQSPIEVLEITEGGEGITAALVLDRSSSMRGQPIADARSAASNFVRLLQPQDRAAVVAFNDLVTTIHPFSSDTTSLVTAISGIEAESQTAIYDAVIHTVTLTQPESGRRVIILLTDGEDNASRNSFRNALETATDSGIPLFTIGLSLEPGSPEEQNLITLAQNTAGRYYRSPTSGDLQQIYAAIAAELRNQYQVTYNTDNPTTDGTRRLVRIDVQNGEAGSDTSTYVAPDYVVTIAPSTKDRVSPAREFTLDFEIPQNSNYLRHQMKSLTVQIEYNSNYLQVKQPQDQKVLAGALFGPLSEHTIATSVDQARGVITLELTKSPASGLIEGRGMLAHITFQASETLPDSAMLSFRTISHSALDVNDWPIASRATDLTLYSYGLIVWPGDTNQNGKVELTDVTMLGLYWDIRGGGRPTEQNPLTWRAQLADRYPISSAAHSDADASGTIDERDLIPVGLNWGKTKNSPETGAPSYLTSGQTPGGTLAWDWVPTGEPNMYRLSVNYRSGQQEALYGSMLRIRYHDRNLRFTAIQPGEAWRARPLLISSNDQDSEVLSIGLMLTAGAPMLEGSGEILQLLVFADEAPNPEQLSIENAGMVTTDGRVHEINVESSPDRSAPTPDTFVLDHAYPNPFNPATTMRYALPEAGSVEFTIYDLQGRQVFRANEEFPEGGEHRLVWDGRSSNGQRVSSGVYVVQAVAKVRSGGTWHRQQKVTLLK